MAALAAATHQLFYYYAQAHCSFTAKRVVLKVETKSVQQWRARNSPIQHLFQNRFHHHSHSMILIIQIRRENELVIGT